MIRLRLRELLADRSLYWLQKETGVSYNCLLRYFHNTITKPELRILEKICVALDCEVGDLLVIEKDDRAG